MRSLRIAMRLQDISEILELMGVELAAALNEDIFVVPIFSEDMVRARGSYGKPKLAHDNFCLIVGDLRP